MKSAFALLLLAPFLVEPRSTARSAARPPLETPLEARDALDAFHDEWDAARMAFDRAALERGLAPEFRVKTSLGDLSREEFLALVAQPQPGARLTRFSSRVLTLRRDGAVWEAVVEEKLEAETMLPGGKPAKACSLWITRDRFRPAEEGWLALSSEELGSQAWAPGERPPFDDWDD